MHHFIYRTTGLVCSCWRQWFSGPAGNKILSEHRSAPKSNAVRTFSPWEHLKRYWKCQVRGVESPGPHPVDAQPFSCGTRCRERPTPPSWRRFCRASPKRLWGCHHPGVYTMNTQVLSMIRGCLKMGGIPPYSQLNKDNDHQPMDLGLP